MMDQIMLQALQEYDISKLFKVKRRGKDADEMFWSFGKIHGLENLAFATDEELYETKGNPVKIQMIADKYDNHRFDVHSFEHAVELM